MADLGKADPIRPNLYARDLSQARPGTENVLLLPILPSIRMPEPGAAHGRQNELKCRRKSDSSEASSWIADEQEGIINGLPLDLLIIQEFERIPKQFPMACPPEDPETLESGVLFDWYINHSPSSSFYVAGGSHVVLAPPLPAFDSEPESNGSDSARDSEDIVEVAAAGGAESGLDIHSDRGEPVSESIQCAAVDEVDPRCAGLRVVSIDSDSDSEYLESENFHSFDLESQRNLAEELEWEEVSEQTQDRDEDVTVSSENFTEEFEGGEEDDSVARHLEWEFLLGVNNMQRNLIWDSDPHSAAPDDFFYAAELDIMLDQFVENEVAIRGSPPAAKAAVDDLPLIILSESDVRSSGGVCAVCKDEVLVGDGVRKLPCAHYYHGDCILPWLAIRNSCPICRYELPTDDMEYERSKGRSSGGSVSWDSQVSEEFELFA